MVEKYKWDNSNFTKMVNEYGDRIVKLGEDESKLLMEQLMSSSEVDMFRKNIDKKTEDKKKLINATAIKADFTLGVSKNDTPKALLGDFDDITNISDDDETVEESEQISKNNKEAKALDDDFEETNLNYSIPHENIAPYMEKLKSIAKLVGKNLQDIAFDFITKGPGLTDLDLFKGITNIIKEPVSDDFALMIYNFYEKNSVFNKAYDGLIRTIGNEPGDISKILKKATDNIIAAENVEDKADAKALAIFRLMLQLITVVLHNNYNLIKKEYQKTAKNSKAIDAIYVFYNEIITLKQANGTLGQKPSIEELTTIINGPYKKCLETAGIGEINPLATLFFMLSSAKASGYMSTKYRNKNEMITRNKFTLSYYNIYEALKMGSNTTNLKFVINELPDNIKIWADAELKKISKNSFDIEVRFNARELNVIYNNDENCPLNFYCKAAEWDKAIKYAKNNNDTAYQTIADVFKTKSGLKGFIAVIMQYEPLNDPNNPKQILKLKPEFNQRAAKNPTPAPKPTKAV